MRTWVLLRYAYLQCKSASLLNYISYCDQMFSVTLKHTEYVCYTHTGKLCSIVVIPKSFCSLSIFFFKKRKFLCKHFWRNVVLTIRNNLTFSAQTKKILHFKITYSLHVCLFIFRSLFGLPKVDMNSLCMGQIDHRRRTDKWGVGKRGVGKRGGGGEGG